RDCNRIMPVGQTAPQIEAAARVDPGNEAEWRQTIDRLLPGARQTLTHLIHVLAIAAARQDARDQFSCDRARTAETGGDLEIDQSVDPVGPGRDIAAAHRGGERLGKAADPDD